MESALEANVTLAQLGDREAIAAVLEAIYSRVYKLSLRILCCPSDAQDAAQEILIRIARNLASFRGHSAFTTWVYRVATNYLITARKSRLEALAYTFERFGSELADNLSDEAPHSVASAEDALLYAEVRVGCTTAMLLCLDRDHRLAYVLGDILEIDCNIAAEILGIRPTAFRKRLSRARADVVGFMRSQCGLVEEANACRCRKRTPHALQIGRINKEQPVFVDHATRTTQFPDVLRSIRVLQDGQRVVALQRLSTTESAVHTTTLHAAVDKVIAHLEQPAEVAYAASDGPVAAE